jgi:DNA polymerase-3 subunit beta
MLDAGPTLPTVTFHAAELRKAVAIAAQVAERRSTIAILGMIRITASKDAAMVRATDLDMEIFAYLDPIEAVGTVDFTIAPRLMASLLRWADGEVTISTNKDMVTIQIDDVEATVRDLCNPATDWPYMDSPVSDQAILSEAMFHKALSACIPCISTEETRYYLNGIWLHQVEGRACMVATDGHRLAKYQSQEAWPFAGQIIHTRTVKLLHRLMKAGGNGEIIAMAAPDQSNSADPTLAPKNPANRVEFRGTGWRLIAKTIDGTYPDYTRVIPQAEAKITAVLTHNALRRMGETNERSRAILIDPVKGRMSYSQPDGPTISMPVQATGEQSIGFNLRYLRDFTARAGTIRLETSGAGDPARVLTDDPALLQVLMPMRV